jgi:hypothetical protein
VGDATWVDDWFLRVAGAGRAAEYETVPGLTGTEAPIPEQVEAALAGLDRLLELCDGHPQSGLAAWLIVELTPAEGIPFGDNRAYSELLADVEPMFPPKLVLERPEERGRWAAFEEWTLALEETLGTRGRPLAVSYRAFRTLDLRRAGEPYGRSLVIERGSRTS